MSGTSWVKVGAVLGFLAVTIGAFGAHGLKDRLDALGTAATFETGVHYHMFHTLAVLAVGLLMISRPPTSGRAENIAGWAFLIGVILFSASLYVLSVTGIKVLGAITPLGGVAFLVGWAAFFVAASSSSTISISDTASMSHASNGASPMDFGIKDRATSREESSR